MAFFWDGVEDTPRSVTTRERSSVPAPVDLDPLLLQGEEYHKGANGDGTRERGRGDTEGERAVIALWCREVHTFPLPPKGGQQLGRLFWRTVYRTGNLCNQYEGPPKGLITHPRVPQ